MRSSISAIVKRWKNGKRFSKVQNQTTPKAAAELDTLRAEVIKYEDYVTLGSEAKCKEAGKMSVEGKEYVVQDGI